MPVENIDVDVVGLETVADRRLERIDRGHIPLQQQVRFADETVPHPPAAPVVGEAHLFGMPETSRIIEKHPQCTIMIVPKLVEPIRRLGDAVDRCLTGFIGHCGDPLGVIHDARRRGIIQVFDGLQEGTNDVRLGRIPFYGGHQPNADPVEIGPQ